MATLTGPKARWVSFPPLPTIRAYAATCCYNGVIYVFGGCNRMGQPLAAAECYSFETNTWKTLPDLAVKRAQPNVLIYQGQLVVIGGCREMNQPVQEVEAFDPVLEEWSKLTPLPFSLAFFSCAVCKDSIYVTGGMSTHGPCNDMTYVLKSGSSEWEASSMMPTKRYACKALTHDDDIYVFGGRVFMTPSSAVESLNTLSNTWTKQPDILDGKMFSPIVQNGGFFYILGGLKPNGEFLNTAEVFDINTKSWKNVTPMFSKRADMATELYKNWIVVVGGQNEKGQSQKSEVYDMVKDVWFNLPDLPTSRCGTTGVVHGNSFVIIGGMGTNGPLGDVDALIFE